MADVWTSKTTTADTSWSVDDDGNVTQEWSDSDTASSSLGASTAAGSAIGTYDSAATAATSLVGSKYHLFDDKEFYFGSDQDVRMSFDTAGGGMLIRVLPAQDEDSTLMTLRNGDVDIIKYMGDRSLQLSEAAELPSNPVEGSIIYSNNNFYMAS